MAKFFNRIRRKLLEAKAFGSYLKYGLGEIVLVVIGILIAIQINYWNEARKLRKIEHNYYESFVEDLKADIESLKKHRGVTEMNMVSAQNVIKVLRSDLPFGEFELETPSPYDHNDTIIFLNSISRAGFIWYPEVTDYTFSDLKSSGGTSVLKNKELKKKIFRYYALLSNYDDWKIQKDEAQRIYQNIQAGLMEPQYRILSNYSEEERAEFLTRNTVDLDEIISRVRSHPEIEAALNAMIYTQDRLLLESGFREIRAERLIEALEEEIGDV